MIYVTDFIVHDAHFISYDNLISIQSSLNVVHSVPCSTKGGRFSCNEWDSPKSLFS